MIDWLKINSGGQTGVDRAALDFALEYKIPCGGWCPKGRIAEDGIIDPKYPLQEAGSSDPVVRTRLNVDDSDAVLVFVDEKMDEGTIAAVDYAQEKEKPLFVVYLQMNLADQEEGLDQFVDEYRVHRVNIVGSRESNSPGIYHKTRYFLDELFWKYTGKG
ncbi:MAG: putative molybdenum carrier protein [Bacteroidales bacterium]|nr:putative molybdenum carrier protein [Bacteroidales bacterium]